MLGSQSAGLRAHELTVGTCTIAVTVDGIGRVLEIEQLEAAVSSDDTSLSMSGGVSGELGLLGGATYVAEARRRAPAAVGTVVVTPPGQLPVRHVLHAITVDWANNVLPSERTVRQLGREIFVRCEGLGIRSIVIPAIATGSAGFSPQVSARIVAAALVEHVRGRTVLDRVVFTLPDAEAYVHFARALFALAGQALPPRLGEIAVSVRMGSEVEERLPLSRDQDVCAMELPPPTAIPARSGSRGWKWPWQRRVDGDTQPMGQPAESVLPAHGDLARPVLGRRYVLLEELGRGGFGVVDLAWDLVLRRTVAIKRMYPGKSDPDLLRREAALAMDLTHEGIVRLYHFEPRSGDMDPFLVMEHVPWSTGEKWIAEAGRVGLPPRVVLEVGRRACDALAYAHGRGILHLDIKPGNLFVDPAAERTKLVDFGLARAVTHERRAFQHQPAGTPAYMPPEQLVFGARLTPATDVYQLTATLWDLLTGEVPVPPRGASPRGRGWPPALEELSRGLALEPSERPVDGAALGVVIERALAAV
jgi:O-acetyl-ADP-ribose deacetylase (regulator of RNase III)